MNKISQEPSQWKKSSFSSTQTNCVEVSSDLGAVRDSKHRKNRIRVGPAAFAAFVAALKAGK